MSSLANSIINGISPSNPLEFVSKLMQQGATSAMKDILKSYVGFLVYITIGIIFIVVMLIFFFCYCCCCCWKKASEENNNTIVLIQIIILALFIFCSIVMFAGISIAFNTSVQLNTALASEDDNLNSLQIIKNSLQEISNYLPIMGVDIEKKLNGTYTLNFTTSFSPIITMMKNSDSMSKLEIMADRVESFKTRSKEIKDSTTNSEAAKQIPDFSTVPSIDVPKIKNDIKSEQNKIVNTDSSVEFSAMGEMLSNMLILPKNMIDSFINSTPTKNTGQRYGSYQLSVFLLVSMVIFIIFILLTVGVVLHLIRKLGIIQFGVGEKLMIIGSFFSFVIYPFFMMLTIILFVCGGLMYALVCRTLTEPTHYKQIDKLIMQNANFTGMSNMSTVPISNLLINCKSKNLGSALEIDVAAMNFDSFTLEADEKLKGLKDKLFPIIDSVNKTEQKFTELQFNYPTGDKTIDQFLNTVKSFQKELPIMLSEFRTEFNNLVNDMEHFLLSQSNRHSSGVIAEILDVINCGVLVSNFFNIVDAICVKIIGPVNGFWCGLGMYLFFTIPTLILILFIQKKINPIKIQQEMKSRISNLQNRIKKTNKVQNKGVEESNNGGRKIEAVRNPEA